MTIEEYNAEIQKEYDIARQAQERIRVLKVQLVQEHSPVKPGWIIEDSRIRIKVESVSFYGEIWDAHGTVLNKDNSPSKKHSGQHTVRVFNLDGPRNSIKVIAKSQPTPAADDASDDRLPPVLHGGGVPEGAGPPGQAR